MMTQRKDPANSNSSTPHVVAIAGGVGGARLASSLQGILPAGALTVVVNTGDDFEHWGLDRLPRPRYRALQPGRRAQRDHRLGAARRATPHSKRSAQLAAKTGSAWAIATWPCTCAAANGCARASPSPKSATVCAAPLACPATCCPCATNRCALGAHRRRRPALPALLCAPSLRAGGFRPLVRRRLRGPGQPFRASRPARGRPDRLLPQQPLPLD